MKIDHEFKEALRNLPQKEKDKLILRLLRKDPMLMKRLYFELVSTDTVEEARSEVEAMVIKKVAYETDSFYSPGYLMMGMRDISGMITDHVKQTKDKYGEIRLNLVMLTESLNGNIVHIEGFSPSRVSKLCIYIVARTYKILCLIKSLHDDYQLDFNEQLMALGSLISSSDKLMRTSIHHGLDVNWLLMAEIPEDIIEIHKQIRANGYLR